MVLALKGRDKRCRVAIVAPFQGLIYLFTSQPRALPWANEFDPFRVHKAEGRLRPIDFRFLNLDS